VEESDGTANGKPVVVRVCKYDGKEYRRWSARLAQQVGPLIVLDAVFDEEVQHDLLGKIPLGTISKEYYWLDRWYNVFRFSDRFYCNVNKPPTFDGAVLTYVDLDIDVLVESDFSYRILDLEEFEANEYTAEVEYNARQALQELIALVETRSFPFDE
jgi:protein associated with RNAse G/E